MSGSLVRYHLLFVFVIALRSNALGNYNPIHARDHVNVFPVAAVAVSEEGISMDGDLSDWKREAFVLLYPDSERRDRYSVRVAFAYDEHGLLLAAQFRDTSPLVNNNDPRTRAERGWEGDALQIRVVADSRLEKPIPWNKLNRDCIAHLSMWCFTDRNEPALDVRYGMNLHGVKTLIGKESGLAFRRGKEDENASTMEGRIPWALLSADGPEPGSEWLFTVQALFGNAAGKLEFDFFECITGRGLQYQHPSGWGHAYFVRPEEVEARFREQAEFLQWREKIEHGGHEAAIVELSKQVCDQIDWKRPELAGADFAEAYRAGKFLEAARGFIRHLRARKEPVLEYSKEYVTELRTQATVEQRKKARKRWLAGNRRNETYALGPTREDFEQLARDIMKKQSQWGLGGWGTTRSITREISKAWPIEECPDEAFIPWFAWLLEQLPGEWAASMKWNETGMANAGHNWWAVTYRGFYQAGLYFPEFQGFEKFRALAPTWIEREAFSLYAPDGFSRERSGYHWVAKDLIACAKVAERNGVKFSDEFHDRIQAIQEVDLKIAMPDGTPEMGDGFAGHNSRRDDSILREAAAHFGPDQVDTCLPDTGFYLMRQSWERHADAVFIDAGARGNGVTSHDHSAVFHILLDSRGRRIITTNGSGPYGDSPARMWRVGSFSHNVATADGRHIVPPRSDMSFEAVIMPVIEDWITEQNFAYFSGVHEGYARGDSPVVSARRKLFYLRGGYWILIDRFTSGRENAEHTYQQHFHLGVPSKLRKAGRVVTEGEGGNLLIVAIPGASGEAKIEPCPYPLKNYDNPDHLTYTQKSVGHGILVSLLVPFVDDKVPEVRVKLLDIEMDDRIASPWEATALEIVIDGQRDVYFDQHMHWNLPWKAGGCEGKERLFHSRCRTKER